MRVDWSPLRNALKGFRRDGLDLPLWWRDDDATQPTKALDLLHETAVRLQVPVHVAVISGLAQPTLASMNASNGMLIPVVHGWKHINHAPPEEKRSEFGTPRLAAAQEIQASFEAMQSIFGAHCLPLFVPPWNRLDPSHVAALRRSGYRGISVFPSRRVLGPTPGIIQVKTHIDPVDWHGTYGLHSTDTIIQKAVFRLQARRRGIDDPAEPLGLLTHHLVHTKEIWQFSENLMKELLDGGARVQPLRPLLETDL